MGVCFIPGGRGPGQGTTVSAHNRPDGGKEGCHLREEHSRNREQLGGFEEQQGCLMI